MSNIKGITIEIGAETKAFKNGLKELNKSSKSLQSELNSVNKALKHDPKNTELLKQKQDLLTKSVGETETKLDALKQAKDKADRDMANGTEINQEEYRKLAREISFTETKLDSLKRETKDFGSVGTQKIKEVGDELEKVGSMMKDVGGKMTATVTAPIVAGATAAVVGTREYREEMAKLETAFTTAGYTAEQAKGTYDGFYAVLGETDRSVEAVNHLAKMSLTQEGLNDWTTIATGVWATFGDSLPIEGLTEAANETAKVGQVVGPLADALNWAGVLEDEFNQKLATTTSEQERQALITETLNGLYSDAAGKYQELNADVIASNEAQTNLNDALANLGTTLEPLVTKLTDFATSLIEKFNNLSPSGQKVVLVVGGIAAVIGPLIVIVGTLISSVGTIMTLAPMLSTALVGVKVAFAAIGGPVTIIMTLIGVLIAKFVHAYNTSEEFRNKVNGAFEKVKEVVTGAVTAVKEKIKEFIDIGKNVVDGLWQGISDSAQWLLDKIKEWCGNILDGVKAFFGIHSPSRVFKEIGKYLVQGLGEGINENGNVAVDEFTKLCDNILDTADEISTGILTKDEETGEIIADNTYKNVMDRIDLYYQDRDKRISLMDEASQKNMDVLQKDIQATQKATDAKIKLYQQEYRAKCSLIDDETDEATKALQAELDAIDQAKEEKARKKEKEDYHKELNGLYDQLNETSGEKNEETLEKIETLKAKRAETLRKQELADKKDAIRKEMEAVREKAAEKKKQLEEELKEKQYNMEQQRKTEIEHMNKILELMQQQVDKKAELEQVQTEIKEKEVKLQTDTMDAEVKTQTQEDLNQLKEREKNLQNSINTNETTLREFTPKLLTISQGYGQAFLQGFTSTENSIRDYVQRMYDYMQSKLGDAVEDEADGSHRTGLGYVPFDGYKSILHRGEMVLTQPEADRYRKSEPQNSSKGDFIINIEKVENSNGRSTKDFLAEAEFYRKSRQVAVGGE